jgi:multidrug efflux pump subunit AcrA (membrane-fusion protein)
VVTDRNVVEQRSIKAGPPEGDSRIVENGLRPDDWVVISAGKKLHPGDSVKPQSVAETKPSVPPKK